MRKKHEEELSLHRKYMAEYEYESMCARYEEECKELSCRFETDAEKHERTKRENIRNYQKARHERDLARILNRINKSNGR